MNLLTIRPEYLARLRELCLSLPETSEKVAWGDPTWRVRDKIFAMQKGNYEGGRPSLWLKAEDGGQDTLVESKPERFFVPPYVGNKGWVGIYMDRGRIPWALVTKLIQESYRLIAPKRLAATAEGVCHEPKRKRAVRRKSRDHRAGEEQATAKRKEAMARRKADRRSKRSIRFKAALQATGSRTVLRLPDAASKQLPSRGQVAVHATINGHRFDTVIEPDGVFGHWMSVNKRLQKAASTGPGKNATLKVEPCDEWPEPSVPPDLRAALSTAPREIQKLWHAITPMARWEWVRWVNATKNPSTRSRRIEASISKMGSGKRRPCCFNLASCTDPELSKGGKLVLD